MYFRWKYALKLRILLAEMERLITVAFDRDVVRTRVTAVGNDGGRVAGCGIDGTWIGRRRLIAGQDSRNDG